MTKPSGRKAPPKTIKAGKAQPPHAPVETQPPEPKGKIAALLALLRRPGGAQIPDMMQATGWQAHSVRGALSGAIKKKLRIAVLSEKTEAGRVYRVAAKAEGPVA